MKRFIFVSFLLFFLILTGTTISQTTHDVSVANFSFTPSQLTIKVGDIVRWTNSGGQHNVVADDNSFTSGDPSSTAWVYEHTFNSAGSNPYYCSLHGAPGGVGMSGVITVEAATDANENSITVEDFKLEQNFPNPFNPTTTINYQVPINSKVSIIIYNMLGNEIISLINEYKPAGKYSLTFDATREGLKLASGVYFYKMQAGNFIDFKKMILMK